MKITRTEIYKYSIPMVPFTIATGTMHFAQNIFIRIHTDAGITGVGECSAFPMITGETQATCFEMAKDFALLWKNKNALEIEQRMNDLHAFTAHNNTAKSAFDMALYDIAAKHASLPLYQFLGGSKKKTLKTDVTVGINAPEQMAAQELAGALKQITGGQFRIADVTYRQNWSAHYFSGHAGDCFICGRASAGVYNCG